MCRSDLGFPPQRTDSKNVESASNLCIAVTCRLSSTITMGQLSHTHCWMSSITIAHKYHLPQSISLDNMDLDHIDTIATYQTNVREFQITNILSLFLQSLKNIPIYRWGWTDDNNLSFLHLSPRPRVHI